MTSTELLYIFKVPPDRFAILVRPFKQQCRRMSRRLLRLNAVLFHYLHGYPDAQVMSSLCDEVLGNSFRSQILVGDAPEKVSPRLV